MTKDVLQIIKQPWSTVTHPQVVVCRCLSRLFIQRPELTDASQRSTNLQLPVWWMHIHVEFMYAVSIQSSSEAVHSGLYLFIILPPTVGGSHMPRDTYLWGHVSKKWPSCWLIFRIKIFKGNIKSALSSCAAWSENSHTDAERTGRLERTGGIFPYRLCSGCPRFHSTIVSLQLELLLELYYQETGSERGGRGAMQRRKPCLLFPSVCVLIFCWIFNI